MNRGIDPRAEVGGLRFGIEGRFGVDAILELRALVLNFADLSRAVFAKSLGSGAILLNEEQKISGLVFGELEKLRELLGLFGAEVS